MFNKKQNDKDNETIWSSEILPKYKNIFEECRNSLVDENILSELENKTKELEIKNNEYKQGFSPFVFFISKFCLFLSAIALFIPWYWAWKWYKSLKNKKEELQKSIEKSQFDKLASQRKLASSINYLEFFNKFDSVIKYQNKGPLTNSLIETLKELSVDDITNDDNSNFFTSSWGVYDNNKIIVHKAKQVFLEYMKTYTGSVTVYVKRTGSDGKTYTESHVVTATYNHIAYSIDDYKTSFGFMESCSSLEFNLDSINETKHDNKKFDKANQQYSPLENKEFEDKFNWHRNNETQFRMFFTPLAQENYVNEYNAVKSKNINPLYLDWMKKTSFVFNKHQALIKKLVWFDIFEVNIYEFITNHNMSYDEFTYNLFKSLVEYYYDIYKSIPYMFLTSLMSSEDHTNIIKHVEENRNKKVSYIELMMMFHNLLNERFGRKIILRNTDCFNKILDVQPIAKSTNNESLYKCKFLGISFIINKLVTYVMEMGPDGPVSVPVYYDDYVRDEANLYSYAGYINDDLIYNKSEKSGRFTNIKDNKILELISEIEKQEYIIVIKNKILSIFTYNPIDEFENNIVDLFKSLNK